MIRQAIENVLERYIKNNSAMKEWEMASKGFMPLTQTIMRDYNKPIDLAYHVTDAGGLRDLKKLQGKKKAISTFKRGGQGISMGARRQAQYLVSLSGVSAFDADKDFNSQLSRDGFKWLDPLRTDKDYIVNNGFTVPMNKKLEKYFGVKNRFQVISAAQDLDGKGKAQFMKWYMDEAKKIINLELLEKIRKSIASKSTNDWTSDEFFLHDIKVKEVKVIKNTEWDEEDMDYSFREEEIKNLGFKFAGYIFSNEIENIDIN